MKMLCKKTLLNSVNDKSIIKNKWYLIDFDGMYIYISKYDKSKNNIIMFKKDLYEFFYTIQEVRKIKICKMLNE